MANGAYIGVDSKARKIKDIFIGVDGKARKVTKAYIGVNGKAQLFWSAVTNKPVILEVEKITSDTYAGETTYTGEQFILLNIYPKTNGTVNVTYGGLTKTIIDTSGAAKPNAQKVFFGTFNGVYDSVATPASGELTIEGDCRAFGFGNYTVQNSSKTQTKYCNCISEVRDWGSVELIPSYAFCAGSGGNFVSLLTAIAEMPNSIKEISNNAFCNCTNLKSITLPSSILSIGINAFSVTLSVDSESISGYLSTVRMLSKTPPSLSSSTGTTAVFGTPGVSTPEFIVPAGCGDTYKTWEKWIDYADYIVEES